MFMDMYVFMCILKYIYLEAKIKVVNIRYGRLFYVDGWGDCIIRFWDIDWEGWWLISLYIEECNF